MYFKIENKESELYQNVLEYIKERQKQELENITSVKEFLGVEIDTKDFIYIRSLLLCLKRIHGVKCDSEIKGMVYDTKFTEYQVPNKRTKRGREIQEFLGNLKNWAYTEELNLFPFNESVYVNRFSKPYVNIHNETIIAFIDDRFEPYETDDFIEITTREFNQLYELPVSKPA